MVRRSSPWLRWCAALGVIAACDDDGPECVLDSDCSQLEICLAGVCQTPSDPSSPRDGGLDDDASALDGGQADGAASIVGIGVVVLRNRPADDSYFVYAGFSLQSALRPCDVQVDGPCTTTTCDLRPPPMDAGMPDAGADPDGGASEGDGGADDAGEGDATTDEDGSVNDDAGPADAGMPAPVHAGTITITGGTEEITLEPFPDAGNYPMVSGSQPLWTSPQTTLSVSAEGATVPAFSFDLTAVAPVVLTSPAVPTTPPFELDRSAPLSLEWQPAEGLSSLPDGNLVFVVSVVDTPMSTAALLVCRFDASVGSAMVAASALTALPPDSTGTLSVTVDHTVEEIIGGWSISAVAETPVLDADDGKLSFEVTTATSDMQ